MSTLAASKLAAASCTRPAASWAPPSCTPKYAWPRREPTPSADWKASSARPRDSSIRPASRRREDLSDEVDGGVGELGLVAHCRMEGVSRLGQRRGPLARARHHEGGHGHQRRLDEGTPLTRFEQSGHRVEGDHGPAQQQLEAGSVGNDLGPPGLVRDRQHTVGVQGDGPVGQPEPREEVGRPPHHHHGPFAVGTCLDHRRCEQLLGALGISRFGGDAGHQTQGGGAPTGAMGGLGERTRQGEVARRSRLARGRQEHVGLVAGRVREPPGRDAQLIPNAATAVGRQGVGQRGVDPSDARRRCLRPHHLAVERVAETDTGVPVVGDEPALLQGL